MDLFQRLMGRASKASSGSRAVDVEQQGSPASSEPLIAAADATASSWRGSGRGADESLPPLIDYDFRCVSGAASLSRYMTFSSQKLAIPHPPQHGRGRPAAAGAVGGV